MAKKKSTAQKQRARARQLRHEQGATAEPGGPHATSPAARPPRTMRPAGRRPATRPRRPSSRWGSWAAIGGVLAVLAVMVVVFSTRNPSGSIDGEGSPAAIAKATSVPASTLDQVGVPDSLPSVPKLPSGIPPVVSDGKPVITYVGAEYCPYCAAERWPVVVALSRFGTFSGLSTTTSAPRPEPFPNTPTFTFHGSSYTSDLVVFSSVEMQTNDPDPSGGWTPLDTPTEQQQQLLATYDTNQYTGSDGGIPFVMIGNLYAWAGATYDASVLEGLSFDQIANRLGDPNSEVAQEVDGAANQITAMICQLTGNQPASVCSAPYIEQTQAKLQGQ